VGNIIDDAIAFFSPEKGLKRALARSRYEMMADAGYIGASKSRDSMRMWSTGAGSPDTDDLPDLPALRGRSRERYRNAPIVRGAIDTKRYNVIGSGLKLQSEPKADILGMTSDEAAEWSAKVEFEFGLWAKSRNCDAERMSDFHELQAIAFISAMLSGDCFAMLPMIRREGFPYALAVKLYEADFVSNPNGMPDSEKIKGGVEVKPGGEVVAYHFSKNHPGGNSYANSWVRVPAYGDSSGRRNVIHIIEKTRPGQKRGVPVLAPVLETLKQLTDYTNAELTAALVSGLYTVFIKTETGGIPPSPYDDAEETDTENTIGLGPGAVVGLAPGESIETSNPGRPNAAFDPFTQSILKQIGASLQVPYELLIKHFSSSYSASRAALLEAWKAFRTRREWFANQFCQPVFEAWMDEAVLSGRIAAPGYFDDYAIRAAYCNAKWNGPTPGQLDPIKETRAAQMRVENRFSTRTREAAEINGSDFDQNALRAIDEEKKMAASRPIETKGGQ